MTARKQTQNDPNERRLGVKLPEALLGWLDVAWARERARRGESIPKRQFVEEALAIGLRKLAPEDEPKAKRRAA